MVRDRLGSAFTNLRPICCCSSPCPHCDLSMPFSDKVSVQFIDLGDCWAWFPAAGSRDGCCDDHRCSVVVLNAAGSDVNGYRYCMCDFLRNHVFVMDYNPAYDFTGACCWEGDQYDFCDDTKWQSGPPSGVFWDDFMNDWGGFLDGHPSPYTAREQVDYFINECKGWTSNVNPVCEQPGCLGIRPRVCVGKIFDSLTEYGITCEFRYEPSVLGCADIPTYTLSYAKVLATSDNSNEIPEGWPPECDDDEHILDYWSSQETAGSPVEYDGCFPEATEDPLGSGSYHLRDTQVKVTFGDIS